MRLIIKFLEKNIKKKKNMIIFHSFPDYTDNSYALFKYMLKNNFNSNEIIWLYDKEDMSDKIYNEFGKKIKCYKKKSIVGIWKFLRSEKVFCTHGVFSFVETENKIINLWHGMPLKNVGLLDKNSKGKVYCDKIISTSDIFREKMSKCFDIENKDVLITGQPRNDLLFEQTNFYKKMNIFKENYNKTIVYLPTYRKSIVGDIRNDSNFDECKLGIFKLDNLEKLNGNLIKNKNLMIIKLHPMDILQKKEIENFSNIIILKTKDLEEINEQLYPLLGSTDLLITDYSSVWVDYEILEKPIYFAMDDYDEYKSNRGFTIRNLPEVLPGEIILNFENLLEKLDNIPDKIQKDSGEIFNKYKDNKSSKRLLEYLNIIKE